MNFNFQNPKNLQNIYSVNPTNESNIPLNPTTYNTIKKQVSINSEFRKKTLVSLEDIIIPQIHKCCVNEDNPSLESSTNFTIDLYEPIDNVISLELVNTQIPNVNPTFSKKKNNNKFIINIYSRGYVYDSSFGLRSYLIQIPDGLWTASNIQNYLNTNYFNYEPPQNQTNHLGYLKFEFETATGKSIFRFKNSSELATYRSSDLSGLLPFTSISGENFYFELLNCDNFNYQNYNFENLNDNSCNQISITDPSEYCKNNINKFIQGFGNPHLHNYVDNFKFTTLGTFGFDFTDIYTLSGDKIVSSKKFYFDQPTIYSLVTYHGFLKSNFIYAQFACSSYYIRVNDFVGNRGEQIIIQGKNQTQITNNVLAIIPIKDSPFSNSLSSSTSDYSIKRNYFGGVKISKLEIQILDKYGQILDFNDFPTNFVFEFTQEYSSERLSNFRNRM